LRRDRRTGFAVRMTNPCGMHLRTEVPAHGGPDPAGGRIVSSRCRRRCMKIQPSQLSAGLRPGTATQPATS
jgi:hypothetical protein